MTAYTDADYDAAWLACAKVRDAAPRLSNDAPSSDVVRAVLDAVAPAITARAKAEALRDLAREANVTGLGIQDGGSAYIDLLLRADEIERT